MQIHRILSYENYLHWTPSWFLLISSCNGLFIFCKGINYWNNPSNHNFFPVFSQNLFECNCIMIDNLLHQFSHIEHYQQQFCYIAREISNSLPYTKQAFSNFWKAQGGFMALVRKTAIKSVYFIQITWKLVQHKHIFGLNQKLTWVR